MSDRLTEALEAALAADGELGLRELLAAVRRAGVDRVSRAAVERRLATDERFERLRVLERDRWRLATGAASDPAGAASEPAGDGSDPGRTSPAATTRERLDDLQLRPWQAEAFAAWSATCRGVVEAVTGTGKTRLAMAAIRTLAPRGVRTLVLVPTLELQDQWVRSLRREAPELRVGRLGGGGQDDLHGSTVLVATPQSAATLPLDVPDGAVGLVVADEAHRYGSPVWARSLPPDFPLRLALTATYERNDDGLAEVLTPYFGPVVFRYGYDRAVPEGSVAPFAVALASVRLEPGEQDRHDRADARARQLHRQLVGVHGMPREPRALLAAVTAVVAAADAQADGPQERACREYLVRLRERREVAAGASGKLAVCAAAAPALAGGRTLVFTDTVAQAEAAAGLLGRAGLRAEAVHGGLTGDRRRIRLAVFRRGDLEVVVAPRVLDEGVDVPDADVALVLAAFRTRRQTIQRLGRVLRVKPDGRAARLVLASAQGTLEDPDRGGHHGFLAEVREVAEEVVRIDVDQHPDHLADWLRRT